MIKIMSKKISIFVWSPFTSKVGTTQNIINSSQGLIKYGLQNKINVKLINVFGEWDQYINEIQAKKIEIYNFRNLKFIKKWKKIGFIRSRFIYLMIFIFSSIPLFFLIRNKKPNFLIIHLITSLPLILFSFFSFKTKLILHFAGHPKLNYPRKLILKLASKKLFKVICPSRELKKILTDENIFKDNQITVIKDSHLEIKKIHFLKKIKLEDDFFDDSKILISIGRLTKQKDYPFLIKNFKKLSIIYSDIKLLIIGDGEEKNNFKNLINNLNLNHKVKLINYNPNVYKYLKKSSFYVSTSIWEGSSLAMVDAAFVGIPILCSDCPSGRKEFIGDNERGFLFKQGNDDDFLKNFSLMYFMEQKNLNRILINAKKETKKFTIFKNFMNYYSLLNE